MKTRVEAFDRTLIVDVMEAADVRANFAKEQLVEVQNINRAALGDFPSYRVFVDGVETSALDSVSPNGTIIFDFDLGTGIVAFIHKLLMDASPVLFGQYRRSHTIYADGVEVEEPRDAEDADEVVILSLVPYARKIEGTGKRPPQSPKAPNGVYQVAAEMAKRRFGNLARVTFTYQDVIGGSSALEAWARGNARRRSGEAKQRRQLAKNMRQPAIYIRFR